MSDLRADIIRILKEHGRPIYTSAIANTYGLSFNCVFYELVAMKNAGIVTCELDGRGENRWSLKPTAPQLNLKGKKRA